MKALPLVALLGSIAVGLPARADFQIAPQSKVSQATHGGSGPIVLSPESPIPARRQVARLSVMPAIPVAHGFGKEVPLAFAARQIVPAKVKVTFGPGVDHAAMVDWIGGRPWVEALQAAVHPLGLRIVVRWMAVSIVRA